MKELTERQGQILRYIIRFTKSHAGPPSIREIAARFEFSLRAAQEHVDALERKGFVTRSRGKARSIIARPVLLPNDNVSCVRAPIVESAAQVEQAGCDDGDFVEIGAPAADCDKSYFAFRVAERGMEGAGILEGDIAVVERAAVSYEGQIVAAALEGALVLRRCFDGGDGRVKLKSDDGGAVVCDKSQIKGALASLVRVY